jgi:RNA processing factor Prp31
MKMMGGALGPEAGELINKINITATSDAVKMDVSFTEEMLEKLKTKMEERKKSMMTPPPTESTEPATEQQEPPKEQQQEPGR